MEETWRNVIDSVDSSEVIFDSVMLSSMDAENSCIRVAHIVLVSQDNQVKSLAPGCFCRGGAVAGNIRDPFPQATQLSELVASIELGYQNIYPMQDLEDEDR